MNEWGCIDVRSTVTGRACDCLLTTLAHAVARRLAAEYQTSLRSLEVDDLAQDIILHTLQNWKYYKPGACPVEAAIRRMVSQGASRCVKKIRRSMPVTAADVDLQTVELSPEVFQILKE